MPGYIYYDKANIMMHFKVSAERIMCRTGVSFCTRVSTIIPGAKHWKVNRRDLFANCTKEIIIKK